MRKMFFLDGDDYEKAMQLLKSGGILPEPVDMGAVAECAESVLFEMGVPQNVKGYQFLIAAICIKLRFGVHESVPVTKIIYPDVAKMFGTIPLTVERDIRFALCRTWAQGLNSNYSQYFQRPLERPHSSLFISTTAAIVYKRLKADSFGG